MADSDTLGGAVQTWQIPSPWIIQPKRRGRGRQGTFFVPLIVAIIAAVHENVIYSSIRAASFCLGNYYINHFKDFTRLFHEAILQFQSLIFSLDTKTGLMGDKYWPPQWSWSAGQRSTLGSEMYTLNRKYGRLRTHTPLCHTHTLASLLYWRKMDYQEKTHTGSERT